MPVTQTFFDSILKFTGFKSPHLYFNLMIIHILIAVWYCKSFRNAISTQQLVDYYKQQLAISNLNMINGRIQPDQSHLLHFAMMVGLSTMQLLFGLGLATILSSKHRATGIFYDHVEGDSGSSKSWLASTVVGTLHYVGIQCTNLGFAYGSASIVQVIKLLEPVETVLLNINPKRKIASVLVIVLGTTLLLTSKGIHVHTTT